MLFLAWSGFVIVLWMVRRIFVTRVQSARIASGYSTLWGQGTLYLLGMKVVLQGPLPEKPFFLVTNHLGYLDIAVLSSQLSCTYVAKAEVSAWPLFGTLASLSGTLYIDRESMRDTKRVNARILEHFASGGSLALFPEGTSTDGNTVAPFRSSLLQFPADTGMPVHCATLRYDAPDNSFPASHSMCWWGNMTLLPHIIRLFSMADMRATLRFAPVPIQGRERKGLAQNLQKTVLSGLEILKDSAFR